MVLLAGVGLGGYRSFASWQTVALPTKVTVLAGINNSGKSNVLRFLQDLIPRVGVQGRADPQVPQLTPYDEPRGFTDPIPLSVGVPLAVAAYPEEKEFRLQLTRGTSDLRMYQAAAVRRLSEDGVTYWSRFERTADRFAPPSEQVQRAIRLWPNWSGQFEAAMRAMGGGTVDPVSVMGQLLTSLGGFEALPPVVTISSARAVRADQGDGRGLLTGSGLVRELSRLQNPTDERWQEANATWTGINDFVRSVLDYPEASLQVPHDGSTIQVRTPERVLPLASLGSGVEQLIVLAAAATVTRDSLVCLEEPETNLHPLLQKKLLRYLTDATSNQYVIATHSAHLLDDDRATSHHVRLTRSGSEVRPARRPHELVRISHDLGYRPSDLLQANCVIWVEGPSDRIYVREWLRLMDPQLQEGIDFAVMFYGGRLLAHLSADEEALEDFIALRQLNRASVVLIDADRSAPDGPLSATKERLQQEFDDTAPAPGFAWLTDCYTIENYLPPDLLLEAVAQAHPGLQYASVGRWDNPLPSRTGGPRFDKIAIARAAAPRMTADHLDRFGLLEQVQRLRDFVRSANGLSVAPDPV